MSLTIIEKTIKIDFIFAPGNHDCDFSVEQTIRDIVIKAVLDNSSKIKTQKTQKT